MNSNLLSAMTVKVFQSIDEIGKDTIDSITHDPFFTYAWFKTLQTQQTYPISPIYLAVYDESKIVGFIPLFMELIDFNSNNTFSKFLKIGHRIGLWQNRLLKCYSPFSYRSELLLSDIQNEKLLLNLLAKEIDSICEKQKILISEFCFVSEFDKLLNENLQNYGYQKNSFPNTTTFYLDVQWSSFEDYLQSLTSKTRKNVKREIRLCVENGVSIEASEVEDLTIKLSKLFTNHALKYDKNAKKFFDPGFFATLNMYAKEEIKLFIAKKNSEVVGFSLLLQQGDILDMFMVGFDYGVQTSSDFSYFNLCFYAPIKWSIENGVKKIYYRWSMEKIKRYRGCKPENTYRFTKYHNKLLRALIRNVVKNPLLIKLKSEFK